MKASSAGDRPGAIAGRTSTPIVDESTLLDPIPEATTYCPPPRSTDNFGGVSLSNWVRDIIRSTPLRQDVTYTGDLMGVPLEFDRPEVDEPTTDVYSRDPAQRFILQEVALGVHGKHENERQRHHYRKYKDVLLDRSTRRAMLDDLNPQVRTAAQGGEQRKVVTQGSTRHFNSSADASSEEGEEDASATDSVLGGRHDDHADELEDDPARHRTVLLDFGGPMQWKNSGFVLYKP